MVQYARRSVRGREVIWANETNYRSPRPIFRPFIAITFLVLLVGLVLSGFWRSISLTSIFTGTIRLASAAGGSPTRLPIDLYHSDQDPTDLPIPGVDSNNKESDRKGESTHSGSDTLHPRQEGEQESVRVDHPIPYPREASCWRTQAPHGNTVMGFLDALIPMKYAYYNVTFSVENGLCYRFACSVNSWAAGYFCSKHSEKLDVAFAAAASIGLILVDARIMGNPSVPEGYLCGISGEEAQKQSRLYFGRADYSNYSMPFEIWLVNSNCAKDDEWQVKLDDLNTAYGIA